MQLAEVSEFGTVADATPRLDRKALPIHALEMAPQPRFAFREEPLDRGFGTGPASPRGQGHGHHDPDPGVDGDPERPRPGRSTEAVLERAAGQVRTPQFEIG